MIRGQITQTDNIDIIDFLPLNLKSDPISPIRFTEPTTRELSVSVDCGTETETTTSWTETGM